MSFKMRPKSTYVYLSEEDRSTIEELATKNNMSISAFIGQALRPYLDHKTEDKSDDEVSKLEQDLAALDDTFDTLYLVSPAQGRRENQVTVYFSDDEYAYVKKAAKGHSISSYIRHNLLRSGGGRFNFIVKTDDIETLTKQNEELNLHFTGFIQALNIRGSINHADVLHCQKLLGEINQNTADLKNAVLKNRYSIRQQGRRYLEKQIRTILGVTSSKQPKQNEVGT